MAIIRPSGLIRRIKQLAVNTIKIGTTQLAEWFAIEPD
ncbi:MAG: hypothetical protein ACJAWM_001469 [Sulfitobacter sp.]|jgi:hypothetical protein